MTAEQQSTAAEIEDLVDVERRQLVAVLEGLDEAGWQTPSLCAGWTVRHLVIHLLMPYELSKTSFLLGMVRRRLSFDRVADDWSTRDRRSAPELVEAVRRMAGAKFDVPGSPVEAPLSHLVIHSEDVYRPLGVRRTPVPRSLDTTLDQLVSPRARGMLAPELRAGVTLVATDTGWRSGDGPEASGPAGSLISVLAGRTAALADLSGPGAELLRSRLAAR